MKKRNIGYLLVLGILAVACSSHDDLFSATAGPTDNGKSQAEKELSITIADNQAWNMVKQSKVTIKDIPANFKSSAIAIMTQNPFTDTLGVGGTLAYADMPSGAVEFEAPNYLQTLYAACISDDGQIIVRPFSVGESQVSMSKTGITFTAASRTFTRAGEAGELVFQPTINAMLFADKGWENDRFALISRGNLNAQLDNFNNYANATKTFIPEGNNNTGKLQKFEAVYNYHWTIVGEGGGQVTLIPVHKQSAEIEYIGYFYCLPGEDINFKDTPKYVFSEGIKDDTKNLPDDYQPNVYQLVYYDKEGNASYTFPEGTKIYFFLHHFPSREAYKQCNHAWNAKLPIDYYSFPDLNRDMVLHLNKEHNINFNPYGGNDNWEESPRVIFFNRNNINYVCMEDGTDMDYNDIICMVQGNVEDFPQSETVAAKSQVFTYAFEDNLYNGDYDLNDVVIRVWRDTSKKGELTVQLVATGAAHDLQVFYDDHGVMYNEPLALFDGKEVHEAMEIEAGTFANTQTNNVSKLPKTNIKYNYSVFRYYKADFYILNKTTGKETHLPAALGITGGAPYAICVPFCWKWPTERTKITKAYAGFEGYAANPAVNQGWYSEPTGNVFTLDE